MFSQLKPAVLMTVVLTILTGLIYPLLVTGLSQALFPYQAHGSLVTRDRAVIGSDLIGQNFRRPEYFHPRPSAAGSEGYDAKASGGSNLGPANPDLAKRLAKDGAAYREENRAQAPIPSDAITTSASGLDPHVSPANAYLQVNRVAAARGVSSEQVRQLVDVTVEGRQLGLLGEPRVNVLRLNLALDRLFGTKTP